MMRTQVAKALMEDLERCGRDNVFAVNRVYGMAFVYWLKGEITIHELHEIQDIRTDCNIKTIENGF